VRNPQGKNVTAKTELENHSAHIKVVDMDVTNDAKPNGLGHKKSRPEAAFY
jgi:hypothetical protein